MEEDNMPPENEHPDSSGPDAQTAPPHESARSKVVYGILSVCLWGLFLDAAVETFVSGSSLRWLVVAIVAVYPLLSGILWRRLGWAGMAGGLVIAMVLTVALSAWLPGGLSHGIVALHQPSAVVLSATTIIAIALAGFTVVQLRSLHRALYVALVIVALYGVAAFAVGMVYRITYSELFHGGSFWLRLPFWLQGAFVGSVVLISLGFVVHVVHGALGVRGRQLRGWAVQGVVMGAGLAMAAAGLRGPLEPRQTVSGGGLVPDLPGRAHAPAQPLLEPELNLLVNGSRHIKLMPGTPLVFTLTLRNGEAARAALGNDAREQLQQELKEEVSSGDLTPQQADETLQQEPTAVAVPGISVTVMPAGFAFEPAEGKTGLPWEPKIADPASPGAVVLNSTQKVLVIFVVAPDQTAPTTDGIFKIRARFDNRTPGQWQGTIPSNRVTIEVLRRPETPSIDQQKEQQVLLGEYYLTIKDHRHALDAAHKVLLVDSGAVDGLALLGKVLEAEQDYRGALDAYEKALAQSEVRYPKADLPPFGLRQSVARMRTRAGA
jgi:hypothetical protein